MFLMVGFFSPDLVRAAFARLRFQIAAAVLSTKRS